MAGNQCRNVYDLRLAFSIQRAPAGLGVVGVAPEFEIANRLPLLISSDWHVALTATNEGQINIDAYLGMRIFLTFHRRVWHLKVG